MIALNIPGFMNAALKLPSVGKLAMTDNNLLYLDVDDRYIHQLFPLLQNKQIKTPDYFGEGGAGAHISVIYPEENTVITKKELNQKHYFKIRSIVMAEIGMKNYHVLMLESPSLLELRRKYALPDMLCFKGYSIGFHITIGVSLPHEYK